MQQEPNQLAAPSRRRAPSLAIRFDSAIFCVALSSRVGDRTSLMHQYSAKLTTIRDDR